jgi:two-component system chemotaxis response regulator CheB
MGRFPNTVFDVVALAASAGGLNALSAVLSNLPSDFPASIVVVQHLDPKRLSLLAKILDRRTPLSVKQAEEGDTLLPGRVFLAPPDRHLVLGAQDHLSLSSAQKMHFVRPSADLMFESVSLHYQERAIAVVLTGTGLDGSAGVLAIKSRGGTIIAQDEATSDFFGMPGAAIQTGVVDFILPLDRIAAKLQDLVSIGDSHS